jgi:hypothetical protein
VLKLNSEGGVFYRSSWEYKIMVWMDSKDEVVLWGAECLDTISINSLWKWWY